MPTRSGVERGASRVARCPTSRSATGSATSSAHYVTGPGRPQIFDAFARSETSFAFALGRRCAFQKRWFRGCRCDRHARRSARRDAGHQDLLDLLIAVRILTTGGPLAADEVRDQCATMIFAGYETTARLLFWASYLLTLDHGEQARLRAEVAAFPLNASRLSTISATGRACAWCCWRRCGSTRGSHHGARNQSKMT